MIEVNGISKSFGNVQVLNNISTVLDTGKCNLIIGRSGSGKTVFLKCMVGLIEPDAGHVTYDGRDYTTISFELRKIVRREVGMLFQGNALFTSMTVEENIRFPLDMFTRMSPKEKKDQVNFCLQRVSLDGSNNKFPSELSGGMMKRVALARAIVMNPKYLFCDEPNSGLDPKTAIVIDELIHDITKEFNMTTAVITHDMNSVMGIGEKVIFLHNGKKHWEGNNKEIMHADNPELIDFIFASDFLKQLRNQAVSAASIKK